MTGTQIIDTPWRKGLIRQSDHFVSFPDDQRSLTGRLAEATTHIFRTTTAFIKFIGSTKPALDSHHRAYVHHERRNAHDTLGPRCPSRESVIVYAAEIRVFRGNVFVKFVPRAQHNYRCRHARERARSAEREDGVRGSRLPHRWTFTEVWTWVGVVASGVFALLWLLLRTGAKPSRFAYPCQQAAFATAAAAFGAPAVATLVTCRKRLAAHLRTATGKITAGGLLGLGLTLLAVASYDADPAVTIMTPPAGYDPEVFLVNNARGIEPVTDPVRYGGVDDLITLMGVHGFKWHRSATPGLTAGPDGMIDADDVVLIKINYQWDKRGGTNVDVLRGVIRRIVEHPDAFTGEVIVCENAQFASVSGFDRAENNAENRADSPHDVVTSFQSLGYDVSHYDWTGMRYTSVGEYSDADMDSGYVVNPVVDPETSIRVSYPKFRSASGTYISYKHGIWSQTSQTYDSDRLVVINIPVFKTHPIYAITGSVKNHMGVVTRELGTDSHNAIGRGGLGSFLAEVRMPDLTILDCIWILARPGSGPSASYLEVNQRDQLVAGTDPVALDMWATKYIMIPQIIENGLIYTNYPSQDPDDPEGKFRQYTDKSMNEMLLAGIEATNDYNAVKLRVWGGDIDLDGDLDLDDFSELQTCITGPDTAIDPACSPFDFNADDALDLSDLADFQRTFTGS